MVYSQITGIRQVAPNSAFHINPNPSPTMLQFTPTSKPGIQPLQKTSIEKRDEGIREKEI